MLTASFLIVPDSAGDWMMVVDGGCPGIIADGGHNSDIRVMHAHRARIVRYVLVRIA